MSLLSASRNPICRVLCANFIERLTTFYMHFDLERVKLLQSTLPIVTILACTVHVHLCSLADSYRTYTLRPGTILFRGFFMNAESLK